MYSQSDACCVADSNRMSDSVAVCAYVIRISYGFNLLNHLAADGTRLARCEIAVVAFLKVYANFAGCFHLELIESVLCLRNEFSVVARCHF